MQCKKEINSQILTDTFPTNNTYFQLIRDSENVSFVPLIVVFHVSKVYILPMGMIISQGKRKKLLHNVLTET